MNETSLSLLDCVRRDGEHEAWQRLFSIYTPMLQAWMLRYDLQASDADDLVQEVLAVVVREVATFEHNGRSGAFRNWLKTILINRLRNFWRQRKYRPQVSGGSDFQTHLQQLEDPASGLSDAWNREHDRVVLAQLWDLVGPHFSEQTRHAFRQHVIEGSAAADVAAELDTTVNAVLIAKSRVLTQLRQQGRGLLDE